MLCENIEWHAAPAKYLAGQMSFAFSHWTATFTGGLRLSMKVSARWRTQLHFFSERISHVSTELKKQIRTLIDHAENGSLRYDRFA